MIATLIVSLRLTPIYESTTTVDIDRQMPTGVLGKDAVEAVSNDADQFLATQVKLIESDSVLRPVVYKFRLREVEKDALEEALDKSALSLEAPIVLKQLRVNASANTYILQISYRSPNRQLAADVANAIAQSYLAHTYASATKPRRDWASSWSPARRAEGQDGEVERRAGPVRARVERHQSRGKDQHPRSRLPAVEHEFTNAQADRVRKKSPPTSR